MSREVRVPAVLCWLPYGIWAVLAVMLLRNHKGEALLVLSACGLALAVVRCVLHIVVPQRYRRFHEAFSLLPIPIIEFAEGVLAAPIYLLFGGVGPLLAFAFPKNEPPHSAAR